MALQTSSFAMCSQSSRISDATLKKDDLGIVEVGLLGSEFGEPSELGHGWTIFVLCGELNS